MDIRRVVLYGALAFVMYSLWMNWQKDYPPFIASTNQSEQLPVDKKIQASNSDSAITIAQKVDSSSIAMTHTSTPIQVRTDVLDLNIDLQQGDIVGAQLLKYPVSVEQKNTPFPLLQSNATQQYVANSGLLTNDGQKVGDLIVNYQSAQSTYAMAPGENTMTVTLTGRTGSGLSINKTFTFTKGSYLIDVIYTLKNEGESTWQGYFNTEFSRSLPKDESSLFAVGSYTGASYANPGVSKYKKVSFKDMSKANLELDIKGGWIAMQQHYFLSAWIENPDVSNRVYTRVIDNHYRIGSVSPMIDLAVASEKTLSSKLYLGPEDGSVLSAISPGLDLTIDYGWLWFLSSLLFSIMRSIYHLLGNWGWSIVLVTVFVKLMFYRLSATSYKSMAGMRKLQPKLAALRERYGDDKAKISQATMELYKQEKVNPLGGCLPIVIQIPVFIALYWVLLESVELRQAPFIFWIKDLAAPDPFHVLPVLMGITMLLQQKLNPAPPDPMQAKVMMLLPLVFTALFWNFPSGLVLYWVVNNTLSITQQWYITRKYGDNAVVKNTTKKNLTAK